MTKRKSNNIGDMNGGWKLLFKASLVMFPPLCAVVGYGAIVLREHDQRLVSMEAVNKDRQMLVDEFRKLRDEVPAVIRELSTRVVDMRLQYSELKDEARQELSELRKLITDMQKNP